MLATSGKLIEPGTDITGLGLVDASRGRSGVWRLLVDVLQSNVEFEDDPTKQLIAALPVAEATPYITQVLFPWVEAGAKMASDGYRFRSTQQAWSAVQLHPLLALHSQSLSTEDVTEIVTGHQRLTQLGRDGVDVSAGMTVDVAMEELLQCPSLTTGMLGSLARLLHRGMWWKGCQEILLALRFIEHPATPMPAVAQSYLSFPFLLRQGVDGPGDDGKDGYGSLVTSFLRRVCLIHPELDGLPVELALAVVASQPVADIWYQDCFGIVADWEALAKDNEMMASVLYRD